MSKMIAAPAWYADGFGPPFVSHEELVRAAFPGPLAWLCLSFGFLRGAAVALLGARRGGLALIKGVPGTATALVISACLRRRPRIALLEFIRRPASSRRWRRLAYQLWHHHIEGPAVRRAMVVGHVMTEWERGEYARQYGLPEERFHHVRWPLCRWGEAPGEPILERGRTVMSSGRGYSDWETLFGAWRGADWDLTVVCGRADLERVRRLNPDGAATVHVELSRLDHDRLLRCSDLYAMVMREAGVSAGHVRLMAAVENGVPVVASDVRALDGYVESGGTAVLVAPGDSAGLRAAIDSLLGDARRRSRLRDEALARARDWTYDRYFAALRTVILEAFESR